LPAVERPQTADDPYKQDQTCEHEYGAQKQAGNCRVLAEQRFYGSRLLRGVLAEGSRPEDPFGRAACTSV
jgi:hypothetical protein